MLAAFNLAVAPLASASTHSPASAEQAATELRATFGDAVQLCMNTWDNGTQPGAPSHREHECPFCCLHAAAALAAPDAPGLPIRRDAAIAPFVAAAFAPPPPARASPAQPRAPPALS